MSTCLPAVLSVECCSYPAGPHSGEASIWLRGDPGRDFTAGETLCQEAPPLRGCSVRSIPDCLELQQHITHSKTSLQVKSKYLHILTPFGSQYGGRACRMLGLLFPVFPLGSALGPSPFPGPRRGIKTGQGVMRNSSPSSASWPGAVPISAVAAPPTQIPDLEPSCIPHHEWKNTFSLPGSEAGIISLLGRLAQSEEPGPFIAPDSLLQSQLNPCAGSRSPAAPLPSPSPASSLPTSPLPRLFTIPISSV